MKKFLTTKFCRLSWLLKNKRWRRTVGCGEWSLNQLFVMGTDLCFPFLISIPGNREKNTRCIKNILLLWSLHQNQAPPALAIGLAHHPHSLQTSAPIGPWPPSNLVLAWSSISSGSLFPRQPGSSSCPSEAALGNTAATGTRGQWALAVLRSKLTHAVSKCKIHTGLQRLHMKKYMPNTYTMSQ